MKLGLGLYRHLLTVDNFRFARQAGASHIVVHLEVFVDEGDVDMLRALRILRKNDYDGVLIPDHTPQMTCAAPWHAGMAFALGYMKALRTIVEAE